MILDKVNMPNDLKQLSLDEMNVLADEMRELIIKKVNTTGGHMGPNLGILEATVALHYVFNSPVDKFVFDVSHQNPGPTVCVSHFSRFSAFLAIFPVLQCVCLIFQVFSLF